MKETHAFQHTARESHVNTKRKEIMEKNTRKRITEKRNIKKEKGSKETHPPFGPNQHHKSIGESLVGGSGSSRPKITSQDDNTEGKETFRSKNIREDEVERKVISKKVNEKISRKRK